MLASRPGRELAGKNRSKMNGVTHGLFCADVVIPGENWDDFGTFRHAYLLQLNPQDIVELTIVDRIVNAAWKLQRLSSIELMANRLAARNIAEAQEKEFEQGKQSLYNHFREVPPVDENEPTIEERMSKIDGITAMTHQFTSRSLDDMERISRYEQRLELSMYRAMRQLERYRKEKRETRKRTQSGEAEPMQPCPFVPESAMKCAIGDEIERSEPKARPPVTRVWNPRFGKSESASDTAVIDPGDGSRRPGRAACHAGESP